MSGNSCFEMNYENDDKDQGRRTWQCIIYVIYILNVNVTAQKYKMGNGQNTSTSFPKKKQKWNRTEINKLAETTQGSMAFILCKLCIDYGIFFFSRPKFLYYGNLTRKPVGSFLYTKTLSALRFRTRTTITKWYSADRGTCAWLTDVLFCVGSERKNRDINRIIC